MDDFLRFEISKQAQHTNKTKLIHFFIAGVQKPTIFIEGGIHAREWISPATVTLFIHELVANEKSVKHYFEFCAHNYKYFYAFHDNSFFLATRK